MFKRKSKISVWISLNTTMILSIPGFGPDISSKVVGAIGNPFRFNNGRQVLKMAGMDLSANRSGKNSDNATPKLSKSGKADLRLLRFVPSSIDSFL
jgi:hypothetical protein